MRGPKLPHVFVSTFILFFCLSLLLSLLSTNDHNHSLMQKPQIILNSLYNLSRTSSTTQREEDTETVSPILNRKKISGGGHMEKSLEEETGSGGLKEEVKEGLKKGTELEDMKKGVKQGKRPERVIQGLKKGIAVGSSEQKTKKPMAHAKNLLPPGVTFEEFRNFVRHQLEGENDTNKTMRVRMKDACVMYQGGVLADPPNYAINRKIYQHLLSHSHRRLIYCPVWKAMSTSWDEYFLQMGQEENTTTSDDTSSEQDTSESRNSKHLSKHYEMAGHVKREARALFRLPPNNKRARNVIKDSLCVVIIVRHPLQRLVSAYRDKMMARNSTVKDYLYLKAIIKHRYSSNTSDVTTTPSFSEFVDFVLDEWRSSDPRPGTWREWSRDWHPIYYLCHPCHLNYTHILRYEHYKSDLEEFRHECQLEQVRLEGTHHHQLGNTSSSQVEQHLYGQLTRSQVLRLAQVYFIDLIMFGYNVARYLQFARPD